MEALQKMGAKPKMIYTDDEKAIASSDFKQYVEDEGKQLYRTRGHPAFSERSIRTFKDKLFKKELKQMKRKAKAMYNGLTTLKTCSLIITRMCIQQLSNSK